MLMLKRTLILIIFIFPLIHFAQDFSSNWQGYFSYNNIKDVSQGQNKIYAAADNSIFSFNTITNEIKELTTINGLSGETISTIYYSEVYELIVIGYENGLIEIAFDDDNENVLTIVDIIDKPTIQPNNKRINHFSSYQNLLYISTNYGISVFNLEKLEFGDTYLIGNNGSQIKVNQTAILGNYIYAACDNGLKKADVTSSNLIDYQNWQTITTGSFKAIATLNTSLYTLNSNRKIYEVLSDNITELFTFPILPLSVKTANNNLIITTLNSVYIYDSSFSLISQVDVTPEINTQFSTATIITDNIYTGTIDSGVLKTPFSSPTSFEKLDIDGPLLNNHFSIEFKNKHLWSAFGGYSLFFNWSGGIRSTGLSHYFENKWSNIPYSYISSNVNAPQFLSHISVNPLNTNQVYVSSYYSGLIELENEEFIKIYNKNNSSIVPFALDFYLTTVSGYDNNGVLWVANGRVEKPLNKFENGKWTSYDFSKIISGPTSNLGFSDLTVGNDNTKWLSTSEYGVIGFKENGSNFQIKNISKESENMPSIIATAVALDKRNQLWIGTYLGLRVLYNTSNFFEDENASVDEIIILEDGIAKELLFQQYITDIKVDGSNNKWIGTSDSGLFYLSPDGQKTIYHFTKDNSPLPSNTINDIAIDETNGTVYIATNKGLLSFKSGGSSPFETLESAYAYPNPVRPNFNIVDDKVKIKDISENVNIKITDVEGNLVAEAQTRTNKRYGGYNLEIDGGTAYWNGKNLANNVVASGVYLVMLSDLDTYETKVLKIMVIR
jgi:hypothetical protein